MGRLGEHAIVVGAGMGGLAAAAALAPHVARVTVLDKDRPGDGAPRMGVGQGAHTHVLLKAGEAALERLLPGFGAAVLAAGAPQLRVGLDLETFDMAGRLPDCDAGFTVTLASRPTYERLAREGVAMLGCVTIRDETPVERLIVEDGRCVGVELADGGRLEADLVVDCTGMNGPLAQRMAADGDAAFETEAVKIAVSYTSGLFEQPPAFVGERRGAFCLPAPPSTQFGFFVPVEGNRWMVSLGTRGAQAVAQDLEGFRAFARSLPAPSVYDRIKDAPLVGDLKTFRKVFATRRRFGAAARWPRDLIALGDAMTSFNPTFGQGMTVAACQAAALADLLATREDLTDLAKDYFPAAERIAGAAWTLAITTDYAYPSTEGERPADYEQSRAMGRMLRELAAHDMEILAARHRIGHMLETGAILRQSPYAEKIEAFMKAAL